MKQNKYDDETFFAKYSSMDRSTEGLGGAGEWPAFQAMLPDFINKRVLDLGCGFGWHCQYALDHGAASAAGVDISAKMLTEGVRKFPRVNFILSSIEDINFPENSFEVVLSSLALHYIKSFDEVCLKVRRCLSPGGVFVFSAEHPVFTAQGPQQWVKDETGRRGHWPVDDYFDEGPRQAVFLGERVLKYHRTVAAYISTLLAHGFEITGFQEPVPGDDLLRRVPEMRDELRRPMMLIVSALKR